MKVEVFCPECKRDGKKKKLLEVDSSTVGIIYPYCKIHKKNIKIELPSA